MTRRSPLSAQSLWSRLLALAEARPQARQLARLADLSDTELAERGLSRRGEILRILGPQALL